ncbi:putative amino-acid transmembrane abc transporter protein [Trichinella spiralis]|uniref:putative amino-acid transmembrane abc transporter protein n=1 Tax=Trichinella spiralis TaxID=6334 RepID=UPI0001EFB3B8|nr:putative amino-acid transmembrane abc transporter protein [Trichinella spiralis]
MLPLLHGVVGLRRPRRRLLVLLLIMLLGYGKVCPALVNVDSQPGSVMVTGNARIELFFSDGSATLSGNYSVYGKRRSVVGRIFQRERETLAAGLAAILWCRPAFCGPVDLRPGPGRAGATASIKRR